MVRKENYCIISNRDGNRRTSSSASLLDLEDFLEFMRCGVYLQHLHSGRVCKAVRVMSDEDNQGKAYGFFEGMQSIAGAFTSLVAVGIFALGDVRSRK